MGRISLLRFMHTESAGGVVLFLATVVALLVANSSLVSQYAALREFGVFVGYGSFSIDKPMILWVNDGLMAIFFLLVGLELKREFLDGQLSSKDQIILPMAAALGGIVVPAGIYALVNLSQGGALHGWAIPAATDIAFALGVLSLFGRRVPLALKVFLTALAIFDDIAAILIIVFFYTANISVSALGVSLGITLMLFVLNRVKVMSLAPYLFLGALMWIAVLKSGVHATLAGVVLAFIIPFGNRLEESPLKKLEHALHPWVAFMILPIFAFLNAGVSLAGINLQTFLEPITLGIALGLLLGKQIGAFGGAWIAVRAGYASLPPNVNWASLYGACLLSGIGFTMSLFIGNLAFAGIAELNAVRLGVIAGSVLSGAGAVIVLIRSFIFSSDEVQQVELRAVRAS